MKAEREFKDVVEVSRTGSIVFGIVVGAIIVLFCVSLMFHSSLTFGAPVLVANRTADYHTANSRHSDYRRGYLRKRS
jgi:hypothetical protein